MSNRSLVNLLQTMTPAVRQSPLRALFLAVAVALCGLMTVADLPSPAPVHAQEQQVTPTKESTGAASPERPTDLEASANHDSVTLTWTASTDDSVTHYAVLRRDRNADASGVFHVIESNAGPGLSYTDDSVSAEGSYVYRVKAVSPTGVSQWSSYARADTPPDPADLAPSGLSAKVVSGDDGVIEGVALAWDAPAEDAASVTGYEVLRAQGDGEMATLVADTGSADTTYTDDTATEAGESYAYRVKALRGQEASQPSNRAVAIIPKATAVEPEPGIAERQTVTEIWSATLSVKDAEGGDLGCHNDVSTAQCSTGLTDVTFDYDNTSYTVYHLFLRPSGVLEFNVTTSLTDTTVSHLTLNIGGTAFALSDASVSAADILWTNSGLSWTIGDSVTVSLTEEAGAVAPTVSSVAVTSDPGADETYAIGDTIQVTVTFDAAVTVTGTPRIQLRIGGGDPEHLKWADYTSGTGNEALVFAYTVQAGDEDTNGIYIAADDLELNGGTIQSSGGTDATLAYTQPGTQSGHKVDGVRPTPVLAATSDDGASVIILFSEPLHMTTAPASAFSLAVDTGTAPAVSSATASGNSLTLGLDSALTSAQSVMVTYVDATSGNDAVAVQDAVGNDAANFTTGEGSVPAVANAVGTGCSVADGCYVVSADWSLIPDGLGAGDRFRLVFLSSTTRNGSSANIADYNTWIQNQASAGHADIQGYSSTFRVVGSTADDDARDNTATRYTGDDTAATDDDSDLGVPIYWLGGPKVADEYRDFYDGSWNDEDEAKDESGSDRNFAGFANWPITGSKHDGTEAFSGSNSRGLGASSVQVGVLYSDTSGPLSSSLVTLNTSSHPLYGLSAVFRVEGQTNAAPVFSADTDIRTVPENSPTGTSVGDPVTATDADNDTLTYTLEGDDALSFGIDSSSGQIQTIAGVTYDHEAKSSYSVTVKADDSNGGTDTIIISIGLTDVDEPPAAPGAPAVSPVSGSSDSLDVSWSAPDNSGKPDIESYDLQYRQGSSGSWTDGPQGVTVPDAIITGLAAGTEYQVRVRATNDEGDSMWSAEGSGSTNAADCPALPAGRLWSACLTAGMVDQAAFGYQGSTSDGSLSDTDFEIGGTTYTVTGLTDSDNVLNFTGVKLTLQPALAATDAGALTLYIGDATSLAFADATPTVLATVSRYDWSLPDALGWSAGQKIVVGISQESTPPPATNAAPVFTSDAAFTADENQTAVGTVIATDADAGDTVTYAVTGGDDQTQFQIDPTSGVLTFAAEPDHENPTDDGTNNVYQVTVTATGGTGAREMTATQAITVTVNDVDEEPAVASVDVTSTPSATADTYGLGETIEVTVTFDQAVTVNTSGGTPSIEFEAGGNQPEHLKLATYAAGSGTATIRFDYVVQSGDMDDNGIWLKADKLELNGGTILGVDDDVAANLDYTSLGRQDDHKVDGSLTLDTTPPALESATVSEDGTIITLVFDEAFEQNAAFGLATTDFSVTAGGRHRHHRAARIVC